MKFSRDKHIENEKELEMLRPELFFFSRLEERSNTTINKSHGLFVNLNIFENCFF